MLRYFVTLEEEGGLVTSFARHCGVPFELVLAHFLRFVKLESAWPVENKLYDDQDGAVWAFFVAKNL